MNKILPREITAYDILKALAVIFMFLDHIGHHFYPEEMWFRVIGRLSVPIWFFLVGYAKNAEKPLYLWAAAILVQCSSLISGQYLFPLNILFTVLIYRHFRAGFILNALKSLEGMRGVFLILLLTTLVTGVVFEYGMFGLLFVIIGHIVRNKQSVLARFEFKYIGLFITATCFSYFIIQGIALPTFTWVQAFVFMGGLVLLSWWMWRFDGRSYPKLSSGMPRVFIYFIHLMGRKTLEIYVVHLLLFRGTCLYFYPEKYVFMQWRWIPESMISAIL